MRVLACCLFLLIGDHIVILVKSETTATDIFDIIAGWSVALPVVDWILMLLVILVVNLISAGQTSVNLLLLVYGARSLMVMLMLIFND